MRSDYQNGVCLSSTSGSLTQSLQIFTDFSVFSREIYNPE